jgi:hypothetical protein
MARGTNSAATNVAEVIVLALIEKGITDPDRMTEVLHGVLDQSRELAHASFLKPSDQRLHAEVCTVIETLLRGTNLHAARQ